VCYVSRWEGFWVEVEGEGLDEDIEKGVFPGLDIINDLTLNERERLRVMEII
jgi:hypothetical protein